MMLAMLILRTEYVVRSAGCELSGGAGSVKLLTVWQRHLRCFRARRSSCMYGAPSAKAERILSGEVYFRRLLYCSNVCNTQALP